MPNANLAMWDHISSTKNPAVEEQHRELSVFLSALAKSIGQRKRRDAQNLALLRFIEYAIYHFKREAGFIGSHEYGDALVEYQKEQDLLARELDDVRRRVAEPDFELDTRILVLLRNVFQTHVLSAKRYFTQPRGRAYAAKG